MADQQTILGDDRIQRGQQPKSADKETILTLAAIDAGFNDEVSRLIGMCVTVNAGALKSDGTLDESKLDVREAANGIRLARAIRVGLREAFSGGE